MKRANTSLNLWVAAALATCALSGTASAQSVLQGTFTLPYEVQWGKAVLPAGAYTISMASVQGPAIVRTSVGQGRAMVIAQFADGARKDLPTSLLILQREGQRIVSSFNWRDGDKNFVYTPVTKAEGKLVGKIEDSVVVPILMAGK
jgi:hypothetical protein